jgi:hypothetical protein
MRRAVTCFHLLGFFLSMRPVRFESQDCDIRKSVRILRSHCHKHKIRCSSHSIRIGWLRLSHSVLNILESTPCEFWSSRPSHSGDITSTVQDVYVEGITLSPSTYSFPTSAILALRTPDGHSCHSKPSTSHPKPVSQPPRGTCDITSSRTSSPSLNTSIANSSGDIPMTRVKYYCETPDPQ